MGAVDKVDCFGRPLNLEADDHVVQTFVIKVAVWNRADHYIFILSFFVLFSFFLA